MKELVKRDNRDNLLIVKKCDSADAAFMPYALFLDMIEAGLFSEQTEELPVS